MSSIQGGILFGNDGAMVVNPNTPTSARLFGHRFMTDDLGCVYVDTVNTPASTDPRRAGFAYTHSGSLYCTTDAVGVGSVVSGGLARTSLGQLHVTFTEPSPKFVQGGITLDANGAVYIAGPIETQAAWFRWKLGITSSGGFVSQWDDQSGNARHLKQTTGTNQPALQSDMSILFPGVDEFMKCDAFTLNQPETVYLLGKQVTWTAADAVYDGNGNDTMKLSQRSGGSSPQITMQAGTLLSLNNMWTLDTYAVVAAVFNSTSSVLQVNNTAPLEGDAGTSNAGGFTLGARASGATSFANIQCEEVIIYAAAHDADQRTRVINYLNSIGDLNL